MRHEYPCIDWRERGRRDGVGVSPNAHRARTNGPNRCSLHRVRLSRMPYAVCVYYSHHVNNKLHY